MILIFGIVSIIIYKNTLCTNKPCVIHVCSNCVIFVPGNVHFLFIFFWGGEGGGAGATAHVPTPPPPHPPPACAPMPPLPGCVSSLKVTSAKK